MKMLLSNFKLITFDVTGTLLNFRSSPSKLYSEVASIYGIVSDENILNNNFKIQWRRLNDEHPNFGLNTGLKWKDWWKKFVIRTFNDSRNEQLDVIAEHLINGFKTSAYWQHCYGTSNLLSYIRSKGIPMGIISNFDPRLHEVVANMKLNHFFKFVLTSYEVGVEKPHKRIYEKAMESSGIHNLNAAECLHIGDKVSLDYFGARNCGWQAILIHEDGKKFENFPDVKRENVFTNLFELHKHFMTTSGDLLSNQVL